MGLTMETNAFHAPSATILQLAAHAVLQHYAQVDKLQESTITVLRAKCPVQHVLHRHQIVLPAILDTSLFQEQVALVPAYVLLANITLEMLVQHAMEDVLSVTEAQIVVQALLQSQQCVLHAKMTEQTISTKS